MSWSLLQNSFLFAALATLLALVFGTTAALLLFASGSRVRVVGLAVAALALALPPFLVANCWLDLLGHTGRLRPWLPVNLYDLRSAAIVMSLMLWPIPLFAALAAWQRLEAAHFEVEPCLTRWALLRHLLLPVAKPSLGTAAVLVFTLALVNFAIPAIFQVKVFTAEIWLRFNTDFDHLGALSASVPVVVVPLLAWGWLRQREMPWPREQGPVLPRLCRQRLGRTLFGATVGVAVLVGLTSVALPLTELVANPRTWTEFGSAWAAGDRAFWSSGWLAALTASLVTLVGLIGWRWRCGAVLWLPFLFPGVFLGLLLIWGLNRPVLTAAYPSVAVVLMALATRYVGVGWQTAALSRLTVDEELVAAVRLAGGSRWQAFRLAVWPQIRTPALAGWYAVFLLCLWDIETVVLVVPPGVETLALRIFNLLHYGHNPQVNALCLALLGLALLPLIFWVCVGAAARWWRSSALPAWALPGIVLGLLGAGCSPASPGDRLLDSRLFERVEVWGTRGRGPGQFNKPRSVAVGRADHVYVADMTGRVQKFNRHGDYVLFWQMPETDLGRPKGLALDGHGRIIVVEPHYSRVNHFTTDGQLAWQWGERGTDPGQLMMPRAIAVNSQGELWVCEYGAAERVQRFSPDGRRLLASLGGFGSGPGEFNRAEGLGVDRQDRLYVADSCNHRIQVFTAEGRWLRSYGHAGRELGALSYPYDVRVDGAGNQYVCEFGNSRVQVFDPTDRPVEIIGGPGAAAGEFSNPWSLALDSDGNLYVADAGNHRVQKLSRKRNLGGEAARSTRAGGRRSPEPNRWLAAARIP